MAACGKCALYDDLVESLAAVEEENERLRDLAGRMAERIRARPTVVVERALSEVIQEMTGIEVPATAPPMPGAPDVVARGRTRSRAGAGRW